MAVWGALAGCQTLESAQRGAQDYADRTGFTKQRIATTTFILTSYHRLERPGAPLVVYIEGDGIPYRNAHQVSPDPTPAHPMMLALAKLDPSPNVAYLGRPCQFDRSAYEPPCEEAYWTDKRFSEEVIASVSEALDALKEAAGAPALELVGFSGGGAVAALAAARREDVSTLRTLAGNLDPGEVNRHHRVPALESSLDPMDAAAMLSRTPQRHFVGGRDRVVPAKIAGNFARAVGGDCVRITVVDEAGHHDGWTERWKKLRELPVSCTERV